MAIERDPTQPTRASSDRATGSAAFRNGDKAAFGRGMRELERRYEGRPAPHDRPNGEPAPEPRRDATSREDDTALRARMNANAAPKGFHRSDARIWDEVCEALTRDDALDAREIEVHVGNGVVTLRGMVQERRDKVRAEAIAGAVRGVHDVMNELRLKRTGGTPQVLSAGGVRFRRRPPLLGALEVARSRVNC